jgi:hypothetical protein
VWLPRSESAKLRSAVASGLPSSSPYPSVGLFWTTSRVIDMADKPGSTVRDVALMLGGVLIGVGGSFLADLLLHGNAAIAFASGAVLLGIALVLFGAVDFRRDRRRKATSGSVTIRTPEASLTVPSGATISHAIGAEPKTFKVFNGPLAPELTLPWSATLQRARGAPEPALVKLTVPQPERQDQHPSLYARHLPGRILRRQARLHEWRSEDATSGEDTEKRTFEREHIAHAGVAQAQASAFDATVTIEEPDDLAICRSDQLEVSLRAEERVPVGNPNAGKLIVGALLLVKNLKSQPQTLQLVRWDPIVPGLHDEATAGTDLVSSKLEELTTTHPRLPETIPLGEPTIGWIWLPFPARGSPGRYAYTIHLRDGLCNSYRLSQGEWVPQSLGGS